MKIILCKSGIGKEIMNVFYSSDEQVSRGLGTSYGMRIMDFRLHGNNKKEREGREEDMRMEEFK